jgi:uncharacterized protein YecE (DUF72 family)
VARPGPSRFGFAVKINQFGTHRLKLRDPARWLPNYLERVTLLGEALGPGLLQLPPRWKRDAGRLEDLLLFATSAPRGTALRWAVEFRDPSWLHEEIYEVLRRYGVALCVHDLLADHPWQRTTGWAYCRFHGPGASNEKYSGEYGAGGLERAVRALSEWRDQGCDVYAYFNNDGGGAAVRDAAWTG